MIKESNIRLTIVFNDPGLDAEEQGEEVQRLLNQMKGMDEVEEVSRVQDPNPPEGSKAADGFLPGLLTAEVNLTNAKALLGFLGNRLSKKTIEMEVEANGKKLKVKANSQAELVAAIEAAQKFIVG